MWKSPDPPVSGQGPPWFRTETRSQVTLTKAPPEEPGLPLQGGFLGSMREWVALTTPGDRLGCAAVGT